MKQKISPNRMELLKLRQRIALAMRGHKLLKDKLDGLVQNFLNLSKNYESLLLDSEAKLMACFTNSIMATGLIPEDIHQQILHEPKVSLTIETRQKNIMGVRVPIYKHKLEGEPLKYSANYSNAELDGTISQFSGMLNQLLELSQLNKTLELMSSQIAEVRRRVNALEYVLIPELKAGERFIRMKLDELELSSRVTMFRVKEVIQ